VRYLDTSSFVALYYPEAKTERLEAHLRRGRSRLPITWLHDLEFTNSLQLKVFREEGTESAVAATLTAIRADIEAGFFFRAQVAWPAVFAGALVRDVLSIFAPARDSDSRSAACCHGMFITGNGVYYQ
jgi:hypothetical protein